MLKTTYSVLCRFYSTKIATAATDKESLMRLRKATGYTFQNCRTAVEKFGNDFENAEKWLREEAIKAGWTKMTATRAATAGLVGTMTNSNELTPGKSGLIFEVNCETDFVARNEKFRQLLTKLGRLIFNNQHVLLVDQQSCRHDVDSEKLNDLKLSDDDDLKGTMLDYIASYSGQLGEKLVLRRACFLTAPDKLTEIFSYAHPRSASFDGIQFGQTASLLALRRSTDVLCENDAVSLQPLGSMLCQHIVGMNPACIGTWDATAIQVKKDEAIEINVDQDLECSESPPAMATTLSDDTELLKQDFLIEPDLKVGQLLLNNNLQVVDFVRIKCGE